MSKAVDYSYRIKFLIVFLLVGFFSPSLTIEKYSEEGFFHIRYSILKSAEARRGGGARAGGMRRGGGMSRSRMRAPSRNRYQGGNFYKSKRPVSRPMTRPSTRPVKKPIHRPARPGNGNRPNRPGKPVVVKPGRPVVVKPGRPVVVKPPVHRPGHGRPPVHRPGHGHGHHHYHHYPHRGWGGYWPWFFGSAIAIGAIVSTIPDDECKDMHVDGKWYKECNGVLFEPVYQGNDVEYKVVKIKK